MLFCKQTHFSIGKGIPSVGAVEVMVLTAGQVILVFMIVFAVFSTSIIVFIGELVHKYLKKPVPKYQENVTDLPITGVSVVDKEKDKREMPKSAE